MSVIFEYLGEFELIFENNVGKNQGIMRVLLKKKILRSKLSGMFT